MSFHCSLHLELLPFPCCFKFLRTEKQSFLLSAGENWRSWRKLRMYMPAVTALITLTQLPEAAGQGGQTRKGIPVREGRREWAVLQVSLMPLCCICHALEVCCPLLAVPCTAGSHRVRLSQGSVSLSAPTSLRAHLLPAEHPSLGMTVGILSRFCV